MRSLVRGLTVLAAATALVLGLSTPALALTGETRLHDPSVIVAGGCYYGFSTGFEGGPGGGSPTVGRSCAAGGYSGWVNLGPVFPAVPAWITTKLGATPSNLWAPDVERIGTTYRLYYTASLWGQQTSAVVGLATAASPAGPWTDQGEVADDHYPIDPDVAYDGTQPYLVTGGFPGVWIRPIGANGRPTGTAPVQIAGGTEGASIAWNGGWFYLFGSRGGCCAGVNSTYYTIVGRSASITGPYVDKAGKSLLTGGGTTVLTGSGSQVAAGGGDVFTDGTTSRFAYHFYDAANAGRETLNIRTLTFSGGWPVFSAPQGP